MAEGLSFCCKIWDDTITVKGEDVYLLDVKKGLDRLLRDKRFNTLELVRVGKDSQKRRFKIVHHNASYNLVEYQN